MVKVIGVRFRTAGKIYYFDPLNFQVKRGDHVIVETARGVEYGTVVGSPREVEDDKVVQPLKPVLRVATERDDEQEAGNKAKEKEAFKICQEKIRKHGLEMKLIDAEYTFDNNKVLFYFTADGRVDFRELVKDRRARRDEDSGRNRYLRQSALLSQPSVRVYSGFHQDGEGAEPFPESGKNFRRVRKTDVLSEA